jgi:hypothetical protein
MLEEVLALFCQRYGLDGPDDSAGVRAIQGAMRGDVSIAEVRRVLTQDYELYPQFEGRVLAILDEIDQTVAAVDAVIPVAEEAAATEVEQPEAQPRKTGRKIT